MMAFSEEKKKEFIKRYAKLKNETDDMLYQVLMKNKHLWDKESTTLSELDKAAIVAWLVSEGVKR
jgi:hypothetical protein